MADSYSASLFLVIARMAAFATMAEFSIRTAIPIGLHQGIENAGVNSPINGGIADASRPAVPESENIRRGMYCVSAHGRW